MLSETHPVGKSKAKFFRMHGFDDHNVDQLEQGLLRIAREEEVADTELAPHGEKFVVCGGVPTPSGRMVEIETVWIVEAEGVPPRFVTAYPA